LSLGFEDLSPLELSELLELDSGELFDSLDSFGFDEP
jgi:hypothetical protein